MPATPTDAVPAFDWSGSPAIKLGMILGLVVLLQIPLFAVGSLIDERRGRQDEVIDGIRHSWGPAQVLTGPTLAVPFVWTEAATQTTPAIRHRKWARVPARTMTVDAALTPETRARGLFRATVYTAAVQVDAAIAVPAIEPTDVLGATVLWNEAVFAVGVSGLRGEAVTGGLEVDGALRPLSVVESSGRCGGVATAPAGLTGPVAPGTVIALRTGLKIRGTQSFAVAPWGQQIDLHVRAPWQTPSFDGIALPLSHAVDDAGFRADWQFSGESLGGSGFSTGSNLVPGCAGRDGGGQDNQVGVALLEAVPTYLMVTRTAKYATLFLALSFLTYFLIEQGARIRIHLAQYALLGLSITLFALIVVAVAEPLGFGAGYAAGTAAVMAQASLYTWSVTQRSRLALLFAGVLGLLFGLLYLVLRAETYALLGGTGALFAILSVVMAATRRLDWTRRA